MEWTNDSDKIGDVARERYIYTSSNFVLRGKLPNSDPWHKLRRVEQYLPAGNTVATATVRFLL